MSGFHLLVNRLREGCPNQASRDIASSLPSAKSRPREFHPEPLTGPDVSDLPGKLRPRKIGNFGLRG